MYFDLKPLGTTLPAIVTRVGFADSAGNIYLGLYVTWDEATAAIYRSTDHGLTWSKLSSTSGFMYTNGAVCGTSDGTNLYLYRQDNTLLRSTDGGATWTAITKYLSSFTVGGDAVVGSPPDSAASMAWDGTYLYLAGGTWVWRSNDQGETWQAVLAWNRNGFAFVTCGGGCVLIGAKTLQGKRSFDHGVTWEDSPGLVATTDWRAGGYRNGYFFFGIGDGYLYTSNDNGTTITRCSESALNGQLIITPPDNNMLYAGWYGNAALYVASAMPPVISPTTGSVLPDGANTITATSVSPDSHVVMTTDGTAPVVPGDVTTLPTTGSATITSPTTVVKAVAAVVPDGIVDLVPSKVVSATYVFKTATPVISPASGTYSAPQTVSITDTASGTVKIVYTLDASDPAYVGDTYDAGYSAGYGSELGWSGISVEQSTGNVYAVSNDTGSGTAWTCSSSSPSTWTQITTIGAAGTGLWSDVCVGAVSTVYVSELTDTSLWRSQDSGATWSNVLQATVGNVLGTSLKYVYADTASTVIISGTGGMARSTDSGETWSVISTFTGVSCGRVTKDYSGSTLFVTTSTGIYKSTDSGETWSAVVGSPTGDAATLGVRGNIWVAYDSALRVSQNGGSSWTAPTYIAGATAAAFTFATDGAIYGSCGTLAGLAVSYDNGTTWSALDTGPIVDTPTLTIDSSNRVWGFDNTTNHFPFRYTRGWTGNLYASSFNPGTGTITVKAIARKIATNYVNSDIASVVLTINQLRTLFAGKDGTWHQVTQVYTGKNGVWVLADMSIGNAGEWK